MKIRVAMIIIQLPQPKWRCTWLAYFHFMRYCEVVWQSVIEFLSHCDEWQKNPAAWLIWETLKTKVKQTIMLRSHCQQQVTGWQQDEGVLSDTIKLRKVLHNANKWLSGACSLLYMSVNSTSWFYEFYSYLIKTNSAKG